MGEGVIERYLQALVDGDWTTFASCLADGGFTRVGPYGDTYSTKADYVRSSPTSCRRWPATRWRSRASPTRATASAFAELAETVAVDGTPLRTPECLAFELADDGRIRRVEVFTQSRAPV